MSERSLWLISGRIQICRETDERTWPGRKLLYSIIILWRTHCCIFSILQTSSLCVSYCVFGFQRQPVSHRCLSLDVCFVCVRQCVFWSVFSVTVSQQHMCCLLDLLTFLKWSGKSLFLLCCRQQYSKNSINKACCLYEYEGMADTCTHTCLCEVTLIFSFAETGSLLQRFSLIPAHGKNKTSHSYTCL